MNTNRIRIAVLLALALGSAAARAETAAPANLVNFSVTASVEVTQDLLAITLQAVRDGADAAVVQGQLKAVLEAALAEAKQAAAPGRLEVRTGGFSLHPRYGRDGKINGWQGQAELLLEGKDAPRVAQTAGRLTGMNITGVGYRVSRDLAAAHDAQVTAQAIQRYRAKAAELAQQFGFTGYALREVAVQSADNGSEPRPLMVRAKAEMAAADAPLPVEPGKSTLSATVSGTVQLTK